MTESEKEAMRKVKNAYRREWSKRNPEKVRAAQEKYWLKQAAKMTSDQQEAKVDEQTTN